MLTKQDLETMSNLLDKKLDKQKKDLEGIIKIAVKKDFQDLKDKIEDLEIKVDEKSSDLYTAVFQVRAELREEARHIKRRLNEVYKDQETIINFFNKEYLSWDKRVSNLENLISPN